jgi:hypothetical protein
MSKDRKILALIHNLFPERRLVRHLAARVEFMPRSDLFFRTGVSQMFHCYFVWDENEHKM